MLLRLSKGRTGAARSCVLAAVLTAVLGSQTGFCSKSAVESSKMKSALIIGATGLVGSHVLEQLVADSTVDSVTVITRRSLGVESKKFKEVITDFDHIANLPENVFAVDAVFSCLGSTAAKSNPDVYKKVEIDYPVITASKALKANCHSFHYVSSIGSSAGSPFGYLKRKGDAENALKSLQAGYPETFVASYRPSFIYGRLNDFRATEGALVTVWKYLDVLLVGPLRKWRGIHARDIAAAMIHEAKYGQSGFHVFESDQVEHLSSAKQAVCDKK